MGIAGKYEASCDPARGNQEAVQAAADNWQRRIDDRIDAMTNTDHVESSRQSIAEALDEHVGPTEMMPLLADLHLALKAEREGRLGGREQAHKAIGAVDQLIYDAVSQEAREEAVQRYA